MSKKTNKQEKYLQVTEVLRKEKTEINKKCYGKGDIF